MPTKPIDRLMFAQGNCCFFCQQPLPKEQATVEHLVALSNGGPNADHNCVACCRTMNQLLGSLSLKAKFEVVLRQKGKFRCPNGVGSAKPVAAAVTPSTPVVPPKLVRQTQTTSQSAAGPRVAGQPVAQPSAANGEAPAPRLLEFQRVVMGLKQRGESRPKTLKALTNTVAAMGKDSPPSDVAIIVDRLIAKGLVKVRGTSVTYTL